MVKIFDKYTVEQSIVGAVATSISFFVIVGMFKSVSSSVAFVGCIMIGWGALYIDQKCHPRPSRIKIKTPMLKAVNTK